MGEDHLSTDHLEQRVAIVESKISELRAMQIADLAELDRRQVAIRDGSRSLSEWVSARLDTSIATARSLVGTMRRTEDRPELRDVLASGEVSFDRVEALSKIPKDVGLMLHADVAAVYREAAKRARLTAQEETRTAENNYFVIEPTLDETWVKFWGGLDGFSGAIVDKVLTEAADQLPKLPDGSKGERSWRKATALVGLCMGEEPPMAQVTVLVDAEQAAASHGEAGVMIEAGPKAGIQALQAILCYSTTEITVNAEAGVPLSYGRRSRAIPPQLRTAILAGNHGYCQVPGCNSRYRVEVHHKTSWSEGGTTDPGNLVALCWFHHHIVVHQRGFRITTDSQTGRIHLIRPPPHRPA